jgi:hypothetical protein
MQVIILPFQSASLSRIYQTDINILVFQISRQSCAWNQQARQRSKSGIRSIFEASGSHVWHPAPKPYTFVLSDFLALYAVVCLLIPLVSPQERDAIKALKVEELSSQV